MCKNINNQLSKERIDECKKCEMLGNFCQCTVKPKRLKAYVNDIKNNDDISLLHSMLMLKNLETTIDILKFKTENIRTPDDIYLNKLIAEVYEASKEYIRKSKLDEKLQKTDADS